MPWTPHPLRLLLVVALTLPGVSLAAPGEASAREQVLGMNIEGDQLTGAQRQALLEVLQDALRRYPDLELLSPPPGELLDEMIDLECVDIDLTCLTRLGLKYNAVKVFYVQVDQSRDKTAWALTVRVVDAIGGMIVRDSRSPATAVGALAGLLEAEVVAVFGAPPAPAAPTPPATGTLVLRATPERATIFLGLERLGTGTVRVERAPGPYTFRIVAEGYEEAILELHAVAGETVARDVALTPIAVAIPKKDDTADDEEGGAGWVLWAVIGAVVVAGAVTAVVLATSSSDEVVRGPVVLSVDPNNAWRDVGVLGGRP